MTGIPQPSEDAQGLAFAAAQAAVDRALERFIVPTVRMGSVEDWCFDTGGFASIVLDGDSESVLAVNGTTESLRPGMRVACLLYPPSGIIVQSLLSPPQPPKHTTVTPLYVGTVPNIDATLSYGTVSTGDPDLFRRVLSLLQVQVEGRYRVDAVIDFNSGTVATGHRRVDCYVVGSTGNTNLVTHIGMAVPGAPEYVTVSFEMRLNIYDGFAFIVRQSSPSDFNVRLARFQIQRIGALTPL